MDDLRVVLDTNVLVSGLAYPGSIPGRILSAWLQGPLEVVLSRYIIEELVRVLPRLPRVPMTQDEIRTLADSLCILCEIIEPSGDPEPQLRDRKDLPVLQTFLAAEAHYLITGDKDLLALDARFPIITPARFWSLHGT